MGPPFPLPGHITALYVFAVINLILMCHMSLVDANVYVLNEKNFTLWDAADLRAQFGPGLPEHGFRGYLHETSPKNACSSVSPPPVTPNETYPWVAVIPRHGCDFSEKVYLAQLAGYDAAIVYNIDSEDLMSMGPGKDSEKVKIPSVFIGYSDALEIIKLCEKTILPLGHRRTVFIYPRDGPVIPIENMLIPFIICVGICCLIMIGVLVGKWVRDWRKRRKARLSKQHLKKLPTKKFKKGDEDYECCAICLDDYEEGDKLRILPCSHAYHMKCVDPWLLNNKRVCPVCKRKVIPGDETDTESESEDEEPHDRVSERTPLLSSQNQAETSTPSTNFDNSGLPETVRREAYIPINDSDDGTLSNQSLQSWVDVHSGRRSPNSDREPVRVQSRFPTLASLVQSARGKNKNKSPDQEASRDRSDSSQSEHGVATAVVSNERRNHRRKKRTSPPAGCRESNGSINEGEEGRVMVCPAADDSDEGAVGGAPASVQRSYGAIEGSPPQGAIGGVAHPLMDVVEDHFSKGKDNQNFHPDDDLPEVEVVSRSHTRKKKKKRKRENDA